MVLKVNIPEKKRTRLDAMGEQLRATEKAIRALEEGHPTVFQTWRNLNEEKEGLMTKMKDEARLQSEEGKTKVLIEMPDLFVSVVGKKKPTLYNPDKVEEFWPDRAKRIVIVRTVSAADVQKALDLKLLSADLALKASYLGEKPTPAVSIKLP
jgi:hypothetical protein